MRTRQLRSIGQQPPRQTQEFLRSSISKALSNTKNTGDLHRVHSLLITLGLHQSVFFSGKLIAKYDQFKDSVASLSVFRTVSPTENVYQWNTIIRAMARNGLFSGALCFYSQMRESNVRPDSYTFPSVINACAGCSDLEMGEIVHDHVLQMGFGSDLYICNALIDMYSRINHLDSARKVFDEMPLRDIVSWNSLIAGYSSHGDWEEALEIFDQSRMAGVLPDSFTASSVLPACGGLMAVEEGQLVHGLVQKLGIKTYLTVSNGLISMYFKFNRSTDCQKIHEEMIFKDAITMNILISGYSQLGLHEHSIMFFFMMICEFTPDLVAITSALRACTQIGDLERGRNIHEYVKRNDYECDTTFNNILINMYAKCGDLLSSREVFDTMQNNRDMVSWNSLINGYVECRRYLEVVEIFKAMRLELKPDFLTYVMILVASGETENTDHAKELHCEIIKLGFCSTLVLGNALVDVYSKCGETEDSLVQFEQMETHDVITWNTVIAACAQSNDCPLGLRMVFKMRTEGLMPDSATMVTALPLCSMLVAKRQGKEIHACILRLGLGFESYVPIGNALIEMYSKTGSLKSALLVFNQINTKDVVTWTTLISAYGMHGEGRRALRAFEDMKASGLIPDHVVFVAILYSCSHSCLVEEGKAYFDEMKECYCIEPRVEHYACMVDLLSRSGQLREAEEFILSMPMKVDVSIWGALLSACRENEDVEIVERVSRRIFELDSDGRGGYRVLASNVYAGLGKWDRVGAIRKLLKERGVKKDPGWSWIDIQNKYIS